VGPFVLTREHGAPVQDWDERHWDEHLPELAAQRHVTTRSVRALVDNAAARRWVVELVTSVAVLGGFLVAPVLTLAAWLGLGMPNGVLLHRLSSTLFVVSLIWICAAVVVAHVHEGGAASSRD
jgi:ribose/xylose/arabinose/galactoside ABC-type transport system permease subunit